MRSIEREAKSSKLAIAAPRMSTRRCRGVTADGMRQDSPSSTSSLYAIPVYNPSPTLSDTCYKTTDVYPTKKRVKKRPQA